VDVRSAAAKIFGGAYVRETTGLPDQIDTIFPGMRSMVGKILGGIYFGDQPQF
jgi:hypothetical protein